MRLGTLALLSLGCAALPCAEPDSGLIDAPVETCRSRLVLGPVELGSTLGPGSGELCSQAALRTGESYSVRLRMFRGAEETQVEARCDSSTDYLDLGYVEPGLYDIVAEWSDGSAVLVGASMFGPCDPDGPLGYCSPIRVVVEECDLDVVPTWLYCGPRGCE